MPKLLHKMTPEQFVERLRSALPTSLKSVVLYGSAAAGDFLPGKSTYNLLVVLHRLGIAELDALSVGVAEWTRNGNDPPLLFTTDQLKSFFDTFPIELADIQQSRKTLFGEDLMATIAVREDVLRLQLEHELNGKLMSLHRHFLQTHGKGSRITPLMTESLSTFLVLFRAALRLFQSEVPAAKFDALTELGKHISIDSAPFQSIRELTANGRTLGDRPAHELFADYRDAIEKLVTAINQYIRAKTP